MNRRKTTRNAVILLILTLFTSSLCAACVSVSASHDASQYRRFSRSVTDALAEHYLPVLPEEIAEDVAVADYRYRYEQMFFGDPCFFVFLTLRYEDDAAFSRELERLEALGPDQADAADNGSGKILLFQQTKDSLPKLFDDEVRDGTMFFLETAEIRSDTKEIRYYTGLQWDGQMISPEVENHLRTILQACDPDSDGISGICQCISFRMERFPHPFS